MDLLLIVRGLAALDVVLWHLIGYKATLPAVVNTPGRTAVWLFFGISGYVIAHGFIHHRYRMTLADLAKFFRNRFLRIYPLFFCLSILAWLTQWVATGASPIGLSDVPAQFLGLQFNQNYVLSGVFWTLGIELQFYVVAPLLVLPLLSTDPRRVWLPVVLYGSSVYGYWYAVHHFGWSIDGRNIISNLPHFVVGMIACRLVSMWRLPWSISLAMACALLGYTSWLYHRQDYEYWSVHGILLVDSVILFLVFAHAPLTRATRAGASRVYAVFAFLGTLSYGVYAWHAYFAVNVPWTIDHFFALTAISLCAAYLSYRYVERPALRLKRHPRQDAKHRDDGDATPPGAASGRSAPTSGEALTQTPFASSTLSASRRNSA